MATPIQVANFLDTHPLLAKWRDDKKDFRNGRGLTLEGHYTEVLWGLGVLFGEPFFAGKQYKSFAHALHDKMQLKCSFEDFHTWSLLATLGHDIGKCSGEFQQMLAGMEVDYRALGGPVAPEGFGTDTQAADDFRTHHWKKNWRHNQLYRHEFLSALLMYHQPDVRAWFRAAAGSDKGFSYVLAGAFGHHIKTQKAFKESRAQNPHFQSLPVFTDLLSNSMNTVLSEHLPKFAPPLPAFPNLTRIGASEEFVRFDLLGDHLTDIQIDTMFWNVGDDQVSGAIKYMVILADTLGSIDKAEYGGSEGCREIILKSLKVVWGPVKVAYEDRIKEHLAGKLSRDWQNKCFEQTKDSQRNIILTGSTGSGKTLGSFLWANASQVSTLIFCGHTTDATTLLRQDYGSPRDHLRHSKAMFDLTYRSTHEENTKVPGEARSADQEALDEAFEMIEVLGGNDRDVTFSTADQVLGIVTFYRKSIMFLPYILKSQIVFDEVASYDPTMRSWLFRFLDWFPGIRTCHMSATLQEGFQKQLTQRLIRPHAHQPGNTPPLVMRGPWHKGSPSWEKRYRLHIHKDRQEVLDQGLFVPGTIWFTNTVGRCQDLADEFPDAVVYHSRFRWKDREKARSKLMESFEGAADEALKMPWDLKGDRAENLLQKIASSGNRVLSTQAAEMSLNISALQMISEISELGSLIQRMGRENRILIDGKPHFGVVDIHLYPHTDFDTAGSSYQGLPYVQGKNWAATYKKWLTWCQKFDGKEVSQKDLEDAYQAFYRDPLNQMPPTGVSTDLLQTMRRSVRQTIITTPVLLKEDFDSNPKMTRHEVIANQVPVILSTQQRKMLYETKKMYLGTFVIPPEFGRYTPKIGFRSAGK